MEVRARTATAADLGELVLLAGRAVTELSANRGGDVWRRAVGRDDPIEEGLRDDLGDDVTHVVCGAIDDVVVGYAVVHVDELRDGSRLGRLTDLYTHDEARGVGVGEAMMDDVITWCAAQGCFGVDSVALPGDRHTKNFFESFGLVARAIVVHRSLEP